MGQVARFNLTGIAVLLALFLFQCTAYAGDINLELMKAVIKADIVDIKAAIEEGADVNFADRGGYTPLYMAADSGDTDVVGVLLDSGASPDKDLGGNTPLMMASMHGFKEIVLALLSKGAKMNIKNRSGWTALMMASSSGRIDVVKSLVEGGADVRIKNKHGQTALDIARQKKHGEIARRLKDGAVKK